MMKRGIFYFLFKENIIYNFIYVFRKVLKKTKIVRSSRHLNLLLSALEIEILFHIANLY